MSQLLLCPSCPIGQRARAEFCALSPGYYSMLALLPYAALLLTPSLLQGLSWARQNLLTLRDRGKHA